MVRNVNTAVAHNEAEGADEEKQQVAPSNEKQNKIWIDTKGHAVFGPERSTSRAASPPPPPVVDGVQFVKVYPHPDENVHALAFRFHLSVHELRRFNRRVIFDWLDNVKYVWVPRQNTVNKDAHKNDDDAREHARFLSRRAFMERCAVYAGAHADIQACVEEEASFYLDEADYQADKAFEKWVGDVTWELEKKKQDKAAAAAAASASAAPSTAGAAPAPGGAGGVTPGAPEPSAPDAEDNNDNHQTRGNPVTPSAPPANEIEMQPTA